MASNASSTVLRQLRFAVASWKEDTRTDVELLHRFVQTREEQAFTTLVGRHSEMVWGACLRVLRNQADADDALQATFLRLARDASRIVNREALAGWLFRVARDCAIDLRRAIARQRRIEERLASVAARGDGATPPTDLRVLLEDELALLSNTDRAVMILVCLQGRTYADTALELGCSVAAVHRRFVRAQTRLRRRLSRHGPAAAVLLTGALAGLAPTAAAVPPRLLAQSVETGLAVARGGTLPDGRAGMLAVGTATGFNRGAAAVLGIAVAIAGGLTAAVGSFAREPQVTVGRDSVTPPGRQEAAEPHPPVSGLVRGADGKPLPGADVVALARLPFAPGERGLRDATLVQTTTDAAGKFTLRVPDDFATWFPDRVVTIQATAPGLAPATLPVRVQGSEAIELRLAGGSALRGRLLGPEDRPAAGVNVEVVRVGAAVVEPVLGGTARVAPPGWTAGVTTDSSGEFTLSAVGGCDNVWVRVTDPRFAFATFRVDRDGELATPEFRLDAAVPLAIEVRTADTGRVVAGARVTVITDRLRTHAHFCATDHAILGPLTLPADIDAITDRDGRVRVGVARGDRVEILVHPPAGDEPLVGVRTLIEVGNETRALNPVVQLPRGRWVGGTVADDTTKRPTRGAIVHWGREDAIKPEWRDDVLVGRDALTRTGPDGRFRIAVLPGACSIRVYGPTLDHAALPARVPGTANSTLFAHAIIPLDVAPEGDIPPLRIALGRGKTVTGHVERPVGDAGRTFALCSGRVSPVRPYACLALSVRDNQFALPGCRLGHVTRVYLLDPVARVGAISDVPPNAPAPVAKLAVCGAIRFRVLGADGLPKVGHEVNASLLVERDRLPADAVATDPQPVEWFDPVNYPVRPKTDASGQVELPALIPGAHYTVTVGTGTAKRTLGRFTVEPGATLTLPDVTLTESGGTK